MTLFLVRFVVFMYNYRNVSFSIPLNATYLIRRKWLYVAVNTFEVVEI